MLENPPAATIREAAQMLRIGRTRLYQLLHDGTLKSIKLGGKRLVLRSSINALFEDAA